jgi:glutamyl-tRNA synthetase
MTDRPARVRIAPSPTGYLHVGTARAALFNFLYARHTGGQFLVRVEDTDKERSKPEFIEPILDGLRWLSLDWDGEIVYQSRRTALYEEYIERFIETGHGYYCFCSKEELQAERDAAAAEKRDTKYSRKCLGLSADEVRERIQAGEKPVVRVRIPDGQLGYHDLVAGELTRQANDIEDFIVARSDGTVTYNFAVVVDDHDMKISHVIRGNDHITNTFKQVALYRAFGWEMPQFCHVPLILRPDKKKVSKRLGDKFIGDYRLDGILPEAMVNYLALLGWSPKTDREIYSLDELTEMFTLESLNASNAVFDHEKLFAFNKEYIQKKSDHDLAQMLAPMLVEAGYSTKYWLETRWEYLRQVVGLLKSRAQFVSDLVELSRYFFTWDGHYEDEADARHFDAESADLLQELCARLEKLADFSEGEIETRLGALAAEREVKVARIIHPTRLAVSGRSQGPGLYQMLAVLGQPIVVERLKQAVAYIRNKS